MLEVARNYLLAFISFIYCYEYVLNLIDLISYWISLKDCSNVVICTQPLPFQKPWFHPYWVWPFLFSPFLLRVHQDHQQNKLLLFSSSSCSGFVRGHVYRNDNKLWTTTNNNFIISLYLYASKYCSNEKTKEWMVQQRPFQNWVQLNNKCLCRLDLSLSTARNYSSE